MKWAELSYILGRVVLVRDFIGQSCLVPKSFVPTLGQLVPGLWSTRTYPSHLVRVHLPDSLITSAEMLDNYMEGSGSATIK